jgi:hypothetical protein
VAARACLGGSMIVQHYVEEIDQRDCLRLVSTSDVFTPTAPTKIGAIWDLAVKKIDQRLTLTRKKVAGIEVPPSVLVFCAFASSKSCLWSSSTFPLFSAASNAFMVGP